MPGGAGFHGNPTCPWLGRQARLPRDQPKKLHHFETPKVESFLGGNFSTFDVPRRDNFSARDHRTRQKMQFSVVKFGMAAFSLENEKGSRPSVSLSPDRCQRATKSCLAQYYDNACSFGAGVMPKAGVPGGKWPMGSATNFTRLHTCSHEG